MNKEHEELERKAYEFETQWMLYTMKLKPKEGPKLVEELLDFFNGVWRSKDIPAIKIVNGILGQCAVDATNMLSGRYPSLNLQRKQNEHR